MIHLVAFLIAQSLTNLDSVIGSAGWAGAGLLGAVLAWLLFKHLPAKDAQMEKILAQKDELLVKLLADKDKQIAEIAMAYEKRAQEYTVFFKESLKSICDSQKTDVEYLGKVLEREVKAMNDGTARIVEQLARIANEPPRQIGRRDKAEVK